MLESTESKKTQIYNDEIDFKKVYSTLINRRLFILTIVCISTILSFIYGMTLPNLYQSSAKIYPSSSNESLSNQMSAMSTIASFAGINVPTGKATKSQEAIERIKSLDFFSEFILPYIKLENLMGISHWVPDKNIIIYDKKKYDSKNDVWVREVSYPKKTIPSDQEAHSVYVSSLNINQDTKTSFTIISFKHKSPFIAKELLDLIIKNINESMRDEDIGVALNSIKYLDNYFKSTNLQSLKKSISNLQEAQMQTLMIASSSDDYVFKILDSPKVSEYKVEPNRFIIYILGALLGFMLACILVLFREYFKIK